MSGHSEPRQSDCPLCNHAWERHDPEDGMCDAHAKVGYGPCPCGRNLAWMRGGIAALSTLALEARHDL